MIVSIFIKNKMATRISLWILLAAGLSAIPVFLSGEGAEEAVEHLPGVLESTIENHEHFAEVSLWIVIGAASLALLILVKMPGRSIARMLLYPTLALGLVYAGTMAYTAHLGGQIRHSEIRQGFVIDGHGNSEKTVHREADLND